MNNSPNNNDSHSRKVEEPLHRKSIIEKTLKISLSTLLSRIFGVVREILTIRYLGAGAVSDAFLTAYKIPNSLRKVFADGAISAAFIPTLVTVVREKRWTEVNSLMTLAFIALEGLALLLCGLVMWQAQFVLGLIAPGFSPVQIEAAIPFLRILMPLIFFLSSSALLAGALQSVGHFFVPAFSPVLFNIVYIVGLIICLACKLPVTYLCVFVLFAGLVQFLMHLIAYWNLEFSFGAITNESLHTFKSILIKLFLCGISISIVEISLFIDTSFASYLPEGSISLIYYANRFMGIPMGMFAVAFSTILLPHFARVGSYARKRLNFYLLETTKLVFWVTIPVALIMAFFSEKIFATMFLSHKFSMEQVVQAGQILQAFLIGLFFFSLNKILLNLYYAIHVTGVPALITAGTTILNICLNALLIHHYQAYGLAIATTIAAIVQTLLFIWVLCRYYSFRFYTAQFALFMGKYLVQLTCILLPFYFLLLHIEKLLHLLPTPIAHFLLFQIGYWLWTGILCLIFAAVVFLTRRWFNVQLYFLGK
ncbi:MAG TPA: murein biosynthesis integral membrane protein MurJ [Candidatus Babeliales bacterium]|nr:murein biosynthesis integral membrane protein MurJ [Candidatus Babeliales bacterium]